MRYRLNMFNDFIIPFINIWINPCLNNFYAKLKKFKGTRKVRLG